MSSVDLRSRRAPGFTLVELVVAVVISGVLATVIFQLIQGQGRFVSMQSARAEVQQNSRGALDLITSEIRSLPQGAIVLAESGRIRYRLPRAWGLLCNVPGSGAVGVVFPPGTFPADFPANTDLPGGWGLALPVSPPDGAAYVTASITAASNSAGACTASAGLNAPAGSEVRQLTAGTFAANAAAVGSPVFVYQEVQYDVAETLSPRGWWIRRRVGTTGTAEPLAGPLLADANGTEGLRFTYYCRTAAGGTRPLTDLELQAAANYLRVDRVGVRVQMQSRSLTRSTFDASTGQQQDSDSLVVTLRNTTGVQPC